MSGSTSTLPAELYDPDDQLGLVALRRDTCTRGQAQSMFAREWDVPFTKVRVRVGYYREDAEYAAEMAADGIKEPYDGWPLKDAKATDDRAEAYWEFVNWDEYA